MHPAVVITTVLGGLFTLAIISVIFSKQANTAGVFSSAGTALGSVIGAAVSPITGNMTNLGAGTTNALGSTLSNIQAINQAG